jgi:hypothetical protein
MIDKPSLVSDNEPGRTRDFSCGLTRPGVKGAQGLTAVKFAKRRRCFRIYFIFQASKRKCSGRF